MPVMWLVAGPNGSGKSTVVGSPRIKSLVNPDAEFINADDIAADLARQAGTSVTLEISIQAATASDAAVDACIDAGRSFLVETVLSSDKCKARVLRARKAGFTVVLLFVTTESPEKSVTRVAERVAKGGHDVPPPKIRKRWFKSIANLPWFALRADAGFIFVNSRVIGNPTLVAYRDNNGWVRDEPCIVAQLDAALRSIQAAT